MADESAAKSCHGSTDAGSAAFGAAHAASCPIDAVTGDSETVYRGPPSAKNVSGSSSPDSMPQSSTQVPFLLTMASKLVQAKRHNAFRG